MFKTLTASLLVFAVARAIAVFGTNPGVLTGSAIPAVGTTSKLAIVQSIRTTTSSTIVTVVSVDSNMSGNYKCNGTSDEYWIQQALNTLGANGGGTLILSDGTFFINNQIVLVSNLLFQGQGMSATTIYTVNNASVFKRAGTIRGINLVNVVLQDFTGSGNRLNNPGNAYTRYTPAYGKFGFYCEVCTNVLLQRIALNSNIGTFT